MYFKCTVLKGSAANPRHSLDKSHMWSNCIVQNEDHMGKISFGGNQRSVKCGMHR